MMALYGISYNYVKNKITWRGSIYIFEINFSGLEIASSSFTIPNFTGSTDDLFCAIPLTGFGNIKRDNRIDISAATSNFRYAHGPGFYYGIITSFSNGSVDCADMKYFLNQDFVVEKIEYTAETMATKRKELEESLDAARNTVISVLDSEFGGCEKGSETWGVVSYNGIAYSDRIRSCLNGVDGMNLPMTSAEVKEAGIGSTTKNIIGCEFSLTDAQWTKFKAFLDYISSCNTPFKAEISARDQRRQYLKSFMASILGDAAFYNDTKITVVYNESNSKYKTLVDNLNTAFADTPTKFNFERPNEVVGYVVDDDRTWQKYQMFKVKIDKVKSLKDQNQTNNYSYVNAYREMTRDLYKYAPNWATPGVNWSLSFRAVNEWGEPLGEVKNLTDLLASVLEANTPGNQNGNAPLTTYTIYLKDNPPAQRVDNSKTASSDTRYSSDFYYHYRRYNPSGDIVTTTQPGITLSNNDIDRLCILAKETCDILADLKSMVSTFKEGCDTRFNAFDSEMKNSRGYNLFMQSGLPNRSKYWWIITGENQSNFIDFYYGRIVRSFNSDTSGWKAAPVYFSYPAANVIASSVANEKFNKLGNALTAYESAKNDYDRYSSNSFYVKDNNPLHYLTMIYDKWMAPFGSPLYIKWLGGLTPYIDRGTDGSTNGKHFTYPTPSQAETQKLSDYAEALFKYYQVTLQPYADEMTDPTGENNPQRSDGTNRSVYAAFISGKDIGNIIIDKSKDVINPDVYVRPAMNGENNAVSIIIPQITKANNDAGVAEDKYDGVKEIDTWYLRKDNELTRDRNDSLIEHPIKKTLYLYTDTSKDPKDITDVEKKNIARQQLEMPSYSHEISFELSKYSDRATEFCQIGNVVTLYYKGIPYKSAITSVNITSSSDYITIKCGNVLSTLSELKVHEKLIIEHGGSVSTSYSGNYVVMSEDDAKNLLLALNNSTSY